MESNKWLEEHNYYRLKPHSSIYVKDIDLTKVFARLFIDASSEDTGENSWNYTHGIYSMENKEKLTNEETEEITTWLLTCSDNDFTAYRSVRDEKR